MRTAPVDRGREFTRFVKETEPRLSYALAAAYGIEIGADATADALAWAWEHWDRVKGMRNPAGYLYRVGQSKARRYYRPTVLFPPVTTLEASLIGPDLSVALVALSRNQRVCAVLIHALDYTEREVADLLGISRWSVRTHAERGLVKLKDALEVRIDA
jgi:RNA polymerase sigma-70 factor (ECF subfamily)